MRMNPMNQINRKRLLTNWAIASAVVGVIGFFFFDTLVYYFASMFILGLLCFSEGLAMLGIICILLQTISWTIAGAIFYVGVFNMIFPRIRMVNGMRTKNTFARKCIQLDTDDEEHIYLKVKFRILPIFDWYTLRLPNPKFHKGYSFKRMPSSIDVHSENIDAAWDSEEECYFITDKPMRRLADAALPYRDDARAHIKNIGESVGESVQGDADMIKDYYTLNLVMDEQNDFVPKHKLKKPKSDIEKDIDEEDYYE